MADSKVVKSTGRRKPPNAGKGRKKGVPNKLTKSAKEAFRLAFDEMGGTEKLAKWAKAHPGEFYKLYARLIPNEIVGKDEGVLVPSQVTIRVVHAAKPMRE